MGSRERGGAGGVGESFNLKFIQGHFPIKHKFLGILISCVCNNLYKQMFQNQCTTNKLQPLISIIKQNNKERFF